MIYQKKSEKENSGKSEPGIACKIAITTTHTIAIV